MARDNTRAKILMAATRIVMERGIARLTLADVAVEACISKGGLLYHFPSKEELIRNMLSEGLKGFAIALEAHVARDSSPGAYTRAYVTTSHPQEKADEVAAALIAGIATDPRLLKDYANELDKWTRLSSQDGLDPILAAVVRLASDGLYFNEALGLAPLPRKERTKFIRKLIELATPPETATRCGQSSKKNAIQNLGINQRSSA